MENSELKKIYNNIKKNSSVNISFDDFVFCVDVLKQIKLHPIQLMQRVKNISFNNTTKDEKMMLVYNVINTAGFKEFVSFEDFKKVFIILSEVNFNKGYIEFICFILGLIEFCGK